MSRFDWNLLTTNCQLIKSKWHLRHIRPNFKPLLSLCFDRLFGTKCERCGRSFGTDDLVMRAKNKIYHLDCFRCVACDKKLVPGDEFALRHEGLFCKDHHEAPELTGRSKLYPNSNVKIFQRFSVHQVLLFNVFCGFIAISENWSHYLKGMKKCVRKCCQAEVV